MRYRELFIGNYRVTTPFSIFFFKREIGFDLPGSPTLYRFTICNECDRVCFEKGLRYLSFAIHGLTSLILFIIYHGLTSILVR